jgi:hypothetical protein
VVVYPWPRASGADISQRSVLQALPPRAPSSPPPPKLFPQLVPPALPSSQMQPPRLAGAQNLITNRSALVERSQTNDDGLQAASTVERRPAL